MPWIKLSLPAIQNWVVRSAAVDDILVPENTCQFALNLNFDRIWAITTRKGLEAIGGDPGGSQAILGMTNYRNNAWTNYKLLVKSNGSIYAYNGSTWWSVRSGLNVASKARFTNFVDYTFMVNWNWNQVCSTYNGSGSFGSTNVASLPKWDFIENYRSRIWIADSSSDKVYYSDVVTTLNTITWGTSFIQISPQDWEKITALKRHSRALLVFKQNHIYRIYSINSADPDPMITVWTYSQESVVDAKDGIYYHHSSGFYKYVDWGQQLEISKPIDDIVKAIPRTYWSNISGWSDDDHVYWSIWDITLDWITYNNFVVCYTISTQIWSHSSYSVEIRSACKYDNWTTQVIAVWADNGLVYTFNSSNSDNTAPINYDLQTHWIYFTQLKSDNKSFTEMAVNHENANWAQISYQIDKDKDSTWKPIWQITKDLYDIKKVNAKNFNRIRFRISGNSVGSQIIFRWFEILNMITNSALRK